MGRVSLGGEQVGQQGHKEAQLNQRRRLLEKESHPDSNDHCDLAGAIQGLALHKQAHGAQGAGRSQQVQLRQVPDLEQDRRQDHGEGCCKGSHPAEACRTKPGHGRQAERGETGKALGGSHPSRWIVSPEGHHALECQHRERPKRGGINGVGHLEGAQGLAPGEHAHEVKDPVRDVVCLVDHADGGEASGQQEKDLDRHRVLPWVGL